MVAPFSATAPLCSEKVTNVSAALTPSTAHKSNMTVFIRILSNYLPLTSYLLLLTSYIFFKQMRYELMESTTPCQELVSGTLRD